MTVQATDTKEAVAAAKVVVSNLPEAGKVVVLEHLVSLLSPETLRALSPEARAKFDIDLSVSEFQRRLNNLVPLNLVPLESLSKEKVKEILTLAKREAELFEERTGLKREQQQTTTSLHLIPAAEMEKFEAWYANSGRDQMGNLVKQLACFIRNINLQGHPGHDRRHILIQDPLAGLGLVGSTVNINGRDEKLEGVRTLFLFPCLFHDIGRLMEPSLARIDACLESGVATEHASISFLYMKYFLENESQATTGMPSELKDHLLFAVLAHARGDYPNHLFAHLTQLCDRGQIYGAEGLRRMMACDVGMKGINLYPASASPGYPNNPQSYGGKEDSNLLGHIEYFMRKGNPFLGRDELLKTSAHLVYLMVRGTEYEKRFFEPELARDRGAVALSNEEALTPEIWAAARSEPSELVVHKLKELRAKYEELDLKSLALAFVEAPAAAPLAQAKAHIQNSELNAAEMLSERITAIPEALKVNLRDALLYALAIGGESAPDAILKTCADNPDPVVRGVALIVREAISPVVSNLRHQTAPVSSVE